MNAFRTPPRPEKKKVRWNPLNLDNALKDGNAMRYVPHLIFLTILGLIYISNNYYSDRTLRKINQLDSEIDILRVDYSTLKYEYIYSSKQSEIAEKVKQYGLIENQKSAYKIQLNND